MVFSLYNSLSFVDKDPIVLSHEPLRVSLEDLHSANTKGKWWLVGAAWGGDPLVDRQAAIEQLSVAQKSAREEENDLVKLARKQGMNSDIRRSIFVVLMSSEVSSLASGHMASMSERDAGLRRRM